MININFDASQFLNKLNAYGNKVDIFVDSSLNQMAETLLLLSRQEVPHDTGNLMTSGNTYKDGKDWVVSYNTVYAQYQHEGRRQDGTHVILHYQKGRKGKYLEDPLKLNTQKWEQIFQQSMANFLKGL